MLNRSQKLRSFLVVSLGGTGVFVGMNIYNGNENFYNNYVMPVVHKFDPETAHRLGVSASKYKLIPKSSYKDPEILKTSVFGKEFSNPVGIAAGFDKQAEAVEGLCKLGFGFVEIGSVTPEPQSGNPKPRVFRLPEDNAVINRYGFNSEGHNIVHDRLMNLKTKKLSGLVGVNLGKNKTTEDPVKDYIEGIKKFSPVADYLVINISSPNTPGLRLMQNKKNLENLLSTLIQTRDKLPENEKRPLLLKLAPDLSKEEKQDIAQILKKKECRVDGLIISNTTVQRNNLTNTKVADEEGGLSGQPLSKVSTEMIAEMYKLTDGMTIIGVGGIFTGEDAYEKIKAGASLIQIYTAFIYNGPPCVPKIKKELAQLLEKDGFKNINEAVGTKANENR